MELYLVFYRPEDNISGDLSLYFERIPWKNLPTNLEIQFSLTFAVKCVQISLYAAAARVESDVIQIVILIESKNCTLKMTFNFGIGIVASRLIAVGC